MEKKKLVIFDLDGTLLDTIEDLGEACNHALARMGFPTHPLQSYRFKVGNGVRKLIERTHPDANEETTEKLLALFREYYDGHCLDKTKPYPGIPELLRKLTDRGVAVAVATNKYQEAARRIVAHFFPDIPFAAVMGQVPDRHTKPDPSVDFAVLSKCPTPKAETVHVGDSAVDIETARRACIDSIGVTWGFRPQIELRRAFADHIVSSVEELEELLLPPEAQPEVTP